jgi:S-adenosylmethionine decarboxylase
MKLHVLLATFSGCDPQTLDDPMRIEALLKRMVEAGRFTLFSIETHRFQPQGVTAAAIVGESHLAIHTWPEEGRLFVDIASCTTGDAATRAIEALADSLPHKELVSKRVDYAPEHGFRS